MPSRRSAFRATRLSPSTFLIKEFDDIYAEHPHIYAIIIPKFESTGVTSSAPTGSILLIDTGCGGAANDPNIKITTTLNQRDTAASPKGSANQVKIVGPLLEATFQPRNSDEDVSYELASVIDSTDCLSL